MAGLCDSFGRTIRYLRLSVSDRCDMRCLYCMSEEPEFLPKEQILSLEELARLARLFIGLGVEKIRVTGGEPLTRRGIGTLFQALAPSLHGARLRELTLTTNGSQLARHSAGLVACGVRRVNVSLDSLTPDIYRTITRRGELSQVLDGIYTARAAGLAVKINMVPLRGLNEHEVDAMIRWCGQNDLDLTLIEAMPLGEFTPLMRRHGLPLSVLRDDLAQRWQFCADDYRSGGPARYVRVAETGRRLGFITALSEHFCEACNRVRLTSTGRLVYCLGSEDGIDLKDPLRSGMSDDDLAELIRRALVRKPERHHMAEPSTVAPPVLRPMHRVGG